jgi:hypothetical protein
LRDKNGQKRAWQAVFVLHLGDKLLAECAKGGSHSRWVIGTSSSPRWALRRSRWGLFGATMPWLSVSGEISNRFVLEDVPALDASNNWQSLATNTITSNPFTLSDTNAAGFSIRFYRARLGPHRTMTRTDDLAGDDRQKLGLL